MTSPLTVRSSHAMRPQGFVPRWARVLALSAVAWACAGSAHAALFGDDEARQAIIDLRSKVESNRQASEASNADLRKQLEDQNASLGRAIFDLTSQLEALRNEVAQLRGQNEQLLKDASDLQRQQKTLGSAVDERLRTLEPVKVSVDGVEFVAQPKEKSDYEAAMAAVRGRTLTRRPICLGNSFAATPTAAMWLRRCSGRATRGMPRATTSPPSTATAP